MRKLFPMLAVAGLCLGASLVVLAADEKTITGDAVCAKCKLAEADACQNVVVVKDGDKETKYYMDPDNKVAKEAHKSAGFCSSSKKVKVTGTTSEKDGKMMIEPTKIEVVKK